jgi:hypothetical protein
MKRITTYALFGAIFAITVGTLGASHISATTFGLAGSVPTTNEDGLKLTGHITLVATDSNGNIKAYRQTDNLVVNNGADCVVKLLFGGGSTRGIASGTGTTCKGDLTTPFNVIAIGTSGTAEAATDRHLGAEILAATDAGLARTAGAITYTSNATSGTAATTISNQFTASTSQGIQESGLFNSTTVSTGGLFAHKTFSQINLVSGDKLTVTWTVNTS